MPDVNDDFRLWGQSDINATKHLELLEFDKWLKAVTLGRLGKKLGFVCVNCDWKYASNAEYWDEHTRQFEIGKYINISRCSSCENKKRRYSRAARWADLLNYYSEDKQVWSIVLTLLNVKVLREVSNSDQAYDCGQEMVKKFKALRRNKTFQEMFNGGISIYELVFHRKGDKRKYKPYTEYEFDQIHPHLHVIAYGLDYVDYKQLKSLTTKYGLGSYVNCSKVYTLRRDKVGKKFKDFSNSKNNTKHAVAYAMKYAGKAATKSDKVIRAVKWGDLVGKTFKTMAEEMRSANAATEALRLADWAAKHSCPPQPPIVDYLSPLKPEVCSLGDVSEQEIPLGIDFNEDFQENMS